MRKLMNSMIVVNVKDYIGNCVASALFGFAIGAVVVSFKMLVIK
jgi:hypothetical protein